MTDLNTILTTISSIGSALAAFCSLAISGFIFRQTRPNLSFKLGLVEERSFKDMQRVNGNNYINVEISNLSNVPVYLGSYGITMSKWRESKKSIFYNSETIDVMKPNNNYILLQSNQTVNFQIQIIGKKINNAVINDEDCINILENIIKYDRFSICNSLGKEFFSSKKNTNYFKKQVNDLLKELKNLKSTKIS